MMGMPRGEIDLSCIADPQTGYEPTTKRLDRLERANRRLTAILCLLGSVALAAAAIGATRGHVRSLDAERVILRDRAGKVRAEFTAAGSGPGLMLFDADGRERLRLHAADDGTTTLSLATPASGHATRRSITFRSGLDGWSTVAFADSTRQERLAIGLGYDGEPRLRMYTKDGAARVTLGSDMSGRVDCILHDVNGSERAVMRSAPGGAATFTAYDDEGKPTFRAP